VVISSRYGSQALTEPCADPANAVFPSKKPVITQLAGFELSEPVVTKVAAFDGPLRPQPPRSAHGYPG
jgi:hypothetical protein